MPCTLRRASASGPTANLRVVPDTSRPYNPLDRVELGKSVERALLSRELVPLPPTARFPGAGVYALYYIGDFEPYRPIAPPAREARDVAILAAESAICLATSALDTLPGEYLKDSLAREVRERHKAVRESHWYQSVVVHGAA